MVALSRRKSRKAVWPVFSSTIELPVEEPAHREQVMVDPALASELDPGEGVPLQPDARHAVEPPVGGAHLAADGSVEWDPGAQQAAQRCAEDAVGQDVHRQLLEVARGPGA